MGVLALAVGCVAIERTGRRGATERAVVAHVGPHPARPGPSQPRRQYRHRGIVSVQARPAQHMPRQCIDQRAEQRCGLAHHVAQRRAAQIDVGTGILFRLPMQWLVVAILRHRDMREQAGAGAATANGQLRHGRLHDGLAGAAGELGPDITDNAEATGNVVEDLGLVAAERMQPATASWAATIGIAWRGMFGDDARQRFRQRRAHRFGNALGLNGCCVACRIDLAGLFLPVGQQQLELFDLGAKLLRGLSERDLQQSGQTRLQRLDLVALLHQTRPGQRKLRALHQHQRTQRLDIVRQVSGGVHHG